MGDASKRVLVDPLVNTSPIGPLVGYGGLSGIQANGGNIAEGWKDIGRSSPFHKNSANIPDLPGITAPQQISVGGPGGIGGPNGFGAAQAATVAGLGRPQAAQVSGLPNDGRNAQLGLLSQLQQQASGQGPSIAEMQLRQGNDQAIASQFALANSARGGANPAALRGAMNNAATLQGQIGQQAAMARLAEQQQAQGLLGNVAGQLQGQDTNVGLANAGYLQQANLTGYQGDLQSLLQNAQNQQTAYGQTYQGNLQKGITDAQLGLDAQKSNASLDLQRQGLMQQGVLGQAGLDQQSDASQKQLVGNLFGAIGTGAASAAKLGSDANMKTNVESGEPAVREFLDALSVNEYDYKNPKTDEGAREGRFVSPMAQDLLKTTVGKAMVTKSDQGHLMVDYGAGFGALLAAQASLNKRLAAIESKKKAG